MRVAFTKMQGLGNDFVLIDVRRRPVAINAPTVRRIADRRLGIGCDQLLLLEPGDGGDPVVRCRIFNADGSEVEHCGNGVRCVARYLLDTGPVHHTPITIGLMHSQVTVEPVADGRLCVNMGVPQFEPDAIPLAVPARAESYAIDVAGGQYRFAAVSLGNPHAVLTVADVASAPVAELGPRIERHAMFPARVNVGFMQIIDPHQIRLRVFERGAGETRACGTGACAAAVVGIASGHLRSPVAVALPGGELKIEWAGAACPVWMTGPAETVFVGEIAL
jgi:diaminopimelate epimerase